MLKFTFAAILLMSSVTWAQQPVDAVIAELGYTRYPVLQCPATNEVVKSFRLKIQTLKTAIKNEARCDGIKADVAQLSNLILKDRPEFIDLIAKGQIEGLNVQEQGVVENYVTDLTVTASNLIAVVTGNDACFDEDKKGMSLEFLTSLIGEGSKILSIIGGPQLAPIIGIAGEAITGFMKAMNTIQETRQGYKFDNGDQRIAYAESLCTFYDYHRELETMMVPYDSILRLEELKATLDKQIEVLMKNCPECAQLGVYVEQEIARASVGNLVETENPVWPADLEYMISAKAKEIDLLYTNRLGTLTYRSLKIATWIPLRLEALRASQFTPDIVLATVIGEKNSIEKFLVDNQAPHYIWRLVKNAEDSRKDLDWQIDDASYLLSKINSPDVNAILWAPYQSNEEYYTAIFETLNQARATADETVRAQINTFFKDIESKTRTLNVNLDVAGNYCNFFANANWFRDRIASECSSNWFRGLRADALKYMSYQLHLSAGNGTLLADVPVVTPDTAAADDISADWAESLRRNVEETSLNANYVERRN